MKHGRWLAALVGCVLVGPELSAQGFLLPPPVGSFIIGRTLSPSHHHHHFSSFAAYVSGSYGLGYVASYPSWPVVSAPTVVICNPPPVVISQPVVVVNQPTLPAGLDRAALRRKGIILPGDDDEDEQPPPAKKPPPPPMPAPQPPPAPPEDPSARLLELGKAAFAAQLYGLAERRFRRATTLPQVDPRSFFFLAQAEFALGKYAEAVEAIDTGLRLRPNWPESNFRALDLYDGHATDFTAHLDRLRDAVARFPKDATVLFLLGYEEWFAGRIEQAQALFHRAAALAPERAAIRIFRDANPPAAVKS